MRTLTKTIISCTVTAVVAVGGLVACTGGHSNPAEKQAQNTANSRDNYVPKNDIEGKNYNARMKIADDPTTILWCTAFPTNPSAPIITVPIVGKLTSSNKRPYSTSQVTNNDSYSPELPGSDGMYGASSEYRYGFRPDGVYVDFTGLETLCTTQPSVYQRTKTIIDLESDAGLQAANAAAQAALKAGDPKRAQQLLLGAATHR